jgi:transposase InsO family protein
LAVNLHRETSRSAIVDTCEHRYGAMFDVRIEDMGIRQLRIAPRSPWQNGFAERFVGTLRRELLADVIALGERHLRHLVRQHAA